LVFNFFGRYRFLYELSLSARWVVLQRCNQAVKLGSLIAGAPLAFWASNAFKHTRIFPPEKIRV